MIIVGTSGWQYDDWRGALYPKDLPKRLWLSYYAERFPSVEVNNTFYRLPSEDTFARWRSQTTEGFLFAVKANRFITHIKRLRDCRDPVGLLWSRCDGLRPKLGPVLFQLPPHFPADPQLLRSFVRALPRGMRAAFEFRDRSWETDEVMRILDDAGCALVLADRPGARVTPAVTGGWSYVRFHQGRVDDAGYRPEKLRRWADRIADLPAGDVFAYFNNDTRGAAVRDAEALTGMLVSRRRDPPRARS